MHNSYEIEAVGLCDDMMKMFQVGFDERTGLVRCAPGLRHPWTDFLTLCEQMDTTGFWDHVLSLKGTIPNHSEHIDQLHRRIMREDVLPKLMRVFNQKMRLLCIETLQRFFADINGESATGQFSDLPRAVQDNLDDFIIQVKPVRLDAKVELGWHTLRNRFKPVNKPALEWRHVMVGGSAYCWLTEAEHVYDAGEILILFHRLFQNRRDRDALVKSIQEGTLSPVEYLSPDVYEFLSTITRRNDKVGVA